MPHTRTSDIILLEHPQPKLFTASLGHVWARGMLSFLPMTELVLFVIFTLSGVLFLGVTEPESNRTQMTPAITAAPSGNG